MMSRAAKVGDDMQPVNSAAA